MATVMASDRRCGNCLRLSDTAGSDDHALCPVCRNELKLAMPFMRTRLLDHHTTPMSSARIPTTNRSRPRVANQAGSDKSRSPRSRDVEGVERPALELVKVAHTSPRVLVVDDQMDVRDTTVAILRAEGYVVVRAADGIEALERLRKNEIDVMILDLGLPRMDGPTLLEELDVFPAVVVCSGFGEWDEAEILRRFGSTIVECLHKPVSPIRLIAATAAAAQVGARAS